MLIMYSNHKSIGNMSLEEAALYYNEEAFVKLVKSDEWWKIPTKSDVDQAFEIAKATNHSALQHFRLTDVGKAYLKLRSEEGCQMAYEVAQYKGRNIEMEMDVLLNPIVKVCLALATIKTIALARIIFDEHPNLMCYSFEEKRHLASAEMHLQDQLPKSQNKTALKVVDHVKKAEEYLIARGDTDTIAECESRRLANERQFHKAITIANGIRGKIPLSAARSEIFTICCQFGDEEALRIAFDIAKSHPEYPDNYLVTLIENCKKHNQRDLAIEFSQAIQNEKWREKQIRKLNFQ